MTAFRRHRSFSLRTLFVGVTLLAIPMAWAAYQLNWIRQRHSALASGKLGAFLRCTPSDPERNRYDSAPWQLQIFGEPAAGVDHFYLSDDTTDSEIGYIRSLFPETVVERRCEMFRDSEIDVPAQDSTVTGDDAESDIK